MTVAERASCLIVKGRLSFRLRRPRCLVLTAALFHSSVAVPVRYDRAVSPLLTWQPTSKMDSRSYEHAYQLRFFMEYA